MNILHDPIVHTVNTILLPLESVLYLHEEMHRQRSESGKPLSEKSIERLKRNFEYFAHEGFKEIHDGDFGGCIGNPHNGWEEHRWTSWSVKTMAKMLDEKGLPYKFGEPTEIISL